MALTLVTAPAVEPVTLAEVKDHLRLDVGNQEPAPGAVTVALAGAGVGNVDNGAHRYLCTFVTANGETSAGTVSAAATITDKTANGKVSISAIPIGSNAVTARKLYRTAAGGTTYLYLATISNNTATTYTDNADDASLGAGAPTSNGTDDPLLNLFIKSARAAAERITRRALVTQTWDLRLDRFPRTFELPKTPLQSVTSISYIDRSGDAQTLSASDYAVDVNSEPGRIKPAYGLCWPSTRCEMNAVTVRYVTGYGGADAVPDEIKTWMLIRITTLWENRAQLIVDARTALIELPASFIDGLLDPYIVYSMHSGEYEPR